MKKSVLLVIIAIFLFANPLFSKQKPNILFVFIDDMGYGDLSCYGNKEVETPQIDKLAREGIRFSQFYVNAPICSPSRVAVTTGQYPPRWGINTIIAKKALNNERRVSDYLSLEAPTVARELSKNGYYTAHIGKWHMGGGRDIANAPLITEYGFNESVTQFEGLGERYLATYETLDLAGDSTRDLEKWSAALGKGIIHWEKRYKITGKFVDRAIMAIENAQKSNKPFYINLWPDDVHTPVEPSPKNRGNGSQHDHFNGVIKELDFELGRIFDYIKKHKELAENTLIVVTSDNGPELGVGSAGNFRGCKTNLYEGGIREPFIVWYPSKIKTDQIGSVNNKNVIVGIDLPPTFLSLAGVKNHNIKFDGEDMSDVILGLNRQERIQPIFWQRPTDQKSKNNIDFPDLAIREGNYKLLVNIDGTGAELYNIVEDETEKSNLLAQYPEKAKLLTDKLLKWYATMPSFVDIKTGTEKKYYTNPVSNITGIGDPFVLTYKQTYYLYCTSSINRGFFVWTSKDMVNWEKQGLALSNETPGVLGINRFWAPEVVEYKGRFYMTYSAGDTDDVLKLCLAVSDHPLGPFINYKSPWYEHKLSHIDATIFIDGNKAYTYFVRDCSTNIIYGRETSQIFAAQLSDDLKTFVTEPKLVITPDQPWEDINGTRLWNEGPSVMKHNGKYYMTYSANGFNTHEYCVAYATADNPLGPWVKASENPILKANLTISVSGPGHNSFAYSPDGTELFMVYHAHTFPDKPSGNRAVYIDRVHFTNGKMVVDGPTKSPQLYPNSSK